MNSGVFNFSNLSGCQYFLHTTMSVLFEGGLAAGILKRCLTTSQICILRNLIGVVNIPFFACLLKKKHFKESLIMNEAYLKKARFSLGAYIILVE